MNLFSTLDSSNEDEREIVILSFFGMESERSTKYSMASSEGILGLKIALRLLLEEVVLHHFHSYIKMSQFAHVHGNEGISL